MASQVVIVVLNWNGRDDTLACLQSLRAVVRDGVEVVVVDNGSSDDSVAAIRRAHPDVALIETGRNLGYAGGNNVGIEYALDRGADWVLVLNNDTVCASDLIDCLLAAGARNPKAGLFCPRIFYMEDPQRVCFDGARWDSRSLHFTYPGKDGLESELAAEDHVSDYACGAALFVRAEVIRQAGAFDPRYFLVWEETDWCYRAREKGWSSVVVPTAKVWHKVGASFGSELSPLRAYFSSRNRLVWLFRHGAFNERVRAVAAAARTVVPRWHVMPDVSVPWLKRALWAALDWMQAAAGGGGRLEYLAKRRAFLDFLRGRLGPPPPIVLELNRRWCARRATGSAPASA